MFIARQRSPLPAASCVTERSLACPAPTLPQAQGVLAALAGYCYSFLCTALITTRMIIFFFYPCVNTLIEMLLLCLISVTVAPHGFLCPHA
ncbi:hypothetical protein E2C01_013629 [Portunus trituberculatus]|uniref:Uncharacterized protein n=1 Tax=Portunus trituberculatus TaxID=210409 RepID=A0A5B7DHV8_PORTR|nr:hypothetical protein [Portunus trituberculatus]